MTKRTIVAVMVAAVALVGCGCGRTEKAAPEVTGAEQLAAAPALAAQRVREAAQEADRRQQEHERLKTDKIVAIQQAFGESSDSPSSLSDPSWEKELKGGTTRTETLYSLICAQDLRFAKMGSALQRMNDAEDLPKITWEETGIKPESAVAQYRVMGVSLAKSYFSVFGKSMKERGEVKACHSGEGNWAFTDSLRIMEETRLVMKEAHLTPADVDKKLTSASMRQALLADIKSYVFYMGQRIRGGEASSSDGLGQVLEVVRNAVEEYHFSADQFGLTPDELKRVRAGRD